MKEARGRACRDCDDLRYPCGGCLTMWYIHITGGFVVAVEPFDSCRNAVELRVTRDGSGVVCPIVVCSSIGRACIGLPATFSAGVTKTDQDQKFAAGCGGTAQGEILVSRRAWGCRGRQLVRRVKRSRRNASTVV